MIPVGGVSPPVGLVIHEGEGQVVVGALAPVSQEQKSHGEDQEVDLVVGESGDLSQLPGDDSIVGSTPSGEFCHQVAG